jgi:hypothetical protein
MWRVRDTEYKAHQLMDSCRIRRDRSEREWFLLREEDLITLDERMENIRLENRLIEEQMAREDEGWERFYDIAMAASRTSRSLRRPLKTRLRTDTPARKTTAIK